jgi:hypothetical protein
MILGGDFLLFLSPEDVEVVSLSPVNANFPFFSLAIIFKHYALFIVHCFAFNLILKQVPFVLSSLILP